MLKYPLRCILWVQGCHDPSYVMVWWEVSKCIMRTCYKEL